MRILVIDDDNDVRQLICRMISSEGYEALEASNGKEGMIIIRSDPKIDIVVTDLIMPEQEGLETIKELKRDFPQIKILAISGGGKIDAQNYLAIAKGMGADLALSKPFVRQDFLNAIQKLMDSKK
jgi:CheY-like chemotaxis protein